MLTQFKQLLFGVLLAAMGIGAIPFTYVQRDKAEQKMQNAKHRVHSLGTPWEAAFGDKQAQLEHVNRKAKAQREATLAEKKYIRWQGLSSVAAPFAILATGIGLLFILCGLRRDVI